MQQYTYAQIETVEPYPGEDGSRVISFFVFNTDVHFHVYCGDGREGSEDEGAGRIVEALDDALRACRDRCLFFERHLSRTRSDSDISRAHAASPHPIDVAPETAELVRLACGYCARSRGCFDITMGTVTRLWDFHEGVVPSALELARALPHVDIDAIRVSAPDEAPWLAIEDPACSLDVGGVAKGYIADDLAQLLVAHGVERFAINLGGNVVVRGGRPADEASRPPVHAGDPWKIGIVNPRDPAHYRAIVDVANGSVVTSGLHERRFSKGGRTYHHILSPVDGMPAHTDVTSATIIADRSLDCDGYSTTVLMLGMDDGLAFAESIDGVEAVLISDADEVRWTSGIAERLSLVPTLPSW